MVPLLTLRDVRRQFTTGKKRWGESNTVTAVDSVSLGINRGQAVGLVGESGCGKSTLGAVAAGLIPPSSGTVLYNGADTARLNGEAGRAFRRDVQFIFQDANGSLNPRKNIGWQLAEPLRIHTGASHSRCQEKVDQILSKVGLHPDHARRYPHELSGGQRQRVVVARALMLSPTLVVCDEPTSALDVSVQAQIVNLLSDLRQTERLAYLFISHNLGVTRTICDVVAVMYLGRIVEMATRDEIFNRPRHPYTAMLLASNPDPDPRRKGQFPVLTGDTPSPLTPPAGCAFHPRCRRATAMCSRYSPLPSLDGCRQVSCHYPIGPHSAAQAG